MVAAEDIKLSEVDAWADASRQKTEQLDDSSSDTALVWGKTVIQLLEWGGLALAHGVTPTPPATASTVGLTASSLNVRCVVIATPLLQQAYSIIVPSPNGVSPQVDSSSERKPTMGP